MNNKWNENPIFTTNLIIPIEFTTMQTKDGHLLQCFLKSNLHLESFIFAKVSQLFGPKTDKIC